ncbi:MAG: TlpA family protein disulfide reductase [Rikenellaceae bacterium]|nr:TlpA family protein disulfide reductase [Rikenellaceae bacterium]
MNEIVQPLINERKAKLQARNWTTDDEAEYGRRLPKDLQSQAVRSEGEFMKKYLDFPEVLTPLLWTYMNREFNPFEHVIDRLPEVYQKRLYAHQARMNRGVEELRKSPGYDPTLHEPVEIIPENLKPGEPFVDFTGKAPDGQQKLLSEIIPDKKLILLDFWASWCGPCIKEMPLIAGLHEKYKDQGLVVIGISSDTDEQKWMRAIDQNRMEWLQFISVKGKERIGTLYSVKFIPYTVIIDGDGTILARNLRGEELVARIDALMAR